MNRIYAFLNRTTMYRLLLYFLISLVVVATLFAAVGLLPYNPLNIVTSGAYLSLVCLLANQLFARLFRARANVESQYITALILTLITGPQPVLRHIVFLTTVAVLAMACKYVFALRRRHIFNPAAFAVVVTALLLHQGASWWIGGPLMLPFVLVGGLLVARKTRRFHLVISFLLTYFVMTLVVGMASGSSSGAIAILYRDVILFSALLFFSFVMLVEPITGPSSRRLRIYYGAAIAILFVLYGRIFPYFPYNLEAALLSGNILARLARFDPRLTLALARREQVTADTVCFWFDPVRPVSFQPGQFFEWTLLHPHPDRNGVRRYFTIASSPTESRLLLATKIGNPPSTFKQALLNLKAGEKITVANLEGEFLLPKDPKRACVFIAGGIGITPYRSMIKYMLDKGLSRPITLLYSNRSAEDIVFKDIFDQAEKAIGLKVVYTLTGKNVPADWRGKTGYITAELIREEVPDYQERVFYISGPEPMVMAFERMLAGMGVRGSNVKRDYFPGYAAPAET